MTAPRSTAEPNAEQLPQNGKTISYPKVNDEALAVLYTKLLKNAVGAIFDSATA